MENKIKQGNKMVLLNTNKGRKDYHKLIECKISKVDVKYFYLDNGLVFNTDNNCGDFFLLDGNKYLCFF